MLIFPIHAIQIFVVQNQQSAMIFWTGFTSQVLRFRYLLAFSSFKTVAIYWNSNCVLKNELLSPPECYP